MRALWQAFTPLNLTFALLLKFFGQYSIKNCVPSWTFPDRATRVHRPGNPGRRGDCRDFSDKDCDTEPVKNRPFGFRIATLGKIRIEYDRAGIVVTLAEGADDSFQFTKVFPARSIRANAPSS